MNSKPNLVTVHFHLGARVCQGLYETLPIRPNPTAFTLTLYRPHSLANVFVRPMIPALPAE